MMGPLPDDVELGIACDALKERGLDAMAALFVGLVGRERVRRALATYFAEVVLPWHGLLTLNEVRARYGFPPLDRPESAAEMASLYAGYLLGMSRTDRHAFDGHERTMLRGAAAALARLTGRSDLADWIEPDGVR